MKNESRFAEARKFALAAIGSLGEKLRQIADRNHTPQMPDKWAKARPKNRPSGFKALDKAVVGKFALGRHGNGKSAVDGVTFSPKKDIAKGPANTLSHRQMTLRDKPKSRIARRGHCA